MVGGAPLIAASLIGVLLGSLPTADLLARARGIDLRNQGTGNPGANNALRLGGTWLAGAVLAAEVAKGALAVWLGRRLAADPGGALAAVGATAGNAYNPWFRFRGGKGLAITGGTVAAAWPPMLAALVVVIAASAAILRRSGPATLLTLALFLAGATLGLVRPLPTGWGLSSPEWLAVMALGSALLLAPKHWADTVTPAGPPPSPG